uniref:Uncharacterized protein n=1 Tax=viral metagenome TaxID=1070528 RepID=A0A6M3LEW3_9ZZZZ
MENEILEAKETDVKLEEFIRKLKSALSLMGGLDGDRLEKKTLEEVFKLLTPHGIVLKFSIDKTRIEGKMFG